LSTYLVEQKKAIEVALDGAIQVIYPEKIYEAMRYSLLAGGKRLRPILCLAGCEIAGGTSQMAMPTACALEMIHTMSLIHDDLPAMDNDDYRRGKLTNHKVYGEDIAILAGDGLVCGGILAGASAADLQRLSRFAKNIGLAFQIIDDILDITATQEELGKTAGKDVQAGKVTYPSLWGIEESRRQAKELVADAKAQLAVFGSKAQPLLGIADFITSRSN
ncbi:MAG: polyprenyl synthetase family protein, partial [Oscillatoriales cyanobacterium]